MEELEPKDEQQEENPKTTLVETSPEPKAAEKKPLMQAVREKVEAVPVAVKEGATKAVQFVKDHKGEIIFGAGIAVDILGAIAKAAKDDVDEEGGDGSISGFNNTSEEDEPQLLGNSEPKPIESSLIADDLNVSAPDSRTVYSTIERHGYGKQNYSHNEYRIEGEQVVKYKCRRFKYFNGEENEWVETESVDNSWDLDDPNMPEWLPQYLPKD